MVYPTWNKSLKKHIDSVHVGIKHSCDLCGKMFKQKGLLKRHVKSSHEGITYACDICGKSYAQTPLQRAYGRRMSKELGSLHRFTTAAEPPHGSETKFWTAFT
uniref:C2H2-type domain-containing protein n=1 Tax=Trichogramma kaykai TaxID=54128 RepID=A0ABD2WZE1_9HYME